MPLKIMVVDDEPKIPSLLRSMAGLLHHAVLPLEDYQVARQKGETQRFDVVFVGMRLPDLDGIDLARRIRNSRLNREALIIMLSSTDDIPSLRKALAQGADLVMTKPVAADRLRRMLAAIDSPEWERRKGAARLPLYTEVICIWNGRRFPLHSRNISESGMLLQPSVDVELDQEVELQFKIMEIHASLLVRARIVRKEGTERVAAEFIRLAPEDQNAIQLYVTGRMKDLTPQRDLSHIQPRRLYDP